MVGKKADLANSWSLPQVFTFSHLLHLLCWEYSCRAWDKCNALDFKEKDKRGKQCQAQNKNPGFHNDINTGLNNTYRPKYRQIGYAEYFWSWVRIHEHFLYCLYNFSSESNHLEKKLILNNSKENGEQRLWKPRKLSTCGEGALWQASHIWRLTGGRWLTMCLHGAQCKERRACLLWASLFT